MKGDTLTEPAYIDFDRIAQEQYILARFGYGDDIRLPLASLEIPAFQRHHSKREWKLPFRRCLLTRPVVCEVDGKYLVVDGLHRLEYLKASPQIMDIEIPVVLHRQCTLEEAAQIYYYLNLSSVKLKGQDRFKGLVATGDDTAKQFQIVLKEKYGLDLETTARGKKGPSGQVFTLYDKYGLEHVDKVLGVLNEVWPFEVIDRSPNTYMLRVFGEFLRPAKLFQNKVREWKDEDRDLLVSYLLTHYAGNEGVVHFLNAAKAKTPGGPGGSSIGGGEIVLMQILRDARRAVKNAKKAERELIAA